jgi:hypothetical protein
MVMNEKNLRGSDSLHQHPPTHSPVCTRGWRRTLSCASAFAELAQTVRLLAAGRSSLALPGERRRKTR